MKWTFMNQFFCVYSFVIHCFNKPKKKTKLIGFTILMKNMNDDMNFTAWTSMVLNCDFTIRTTLYSLLSIQLKASAIKKPLPFYFESIKPFLFLYIYRIKYLLSTSRTIRQMPYYIWSGRNRNPVIWTIRCGFF